MKRKKLIYSILKELEKRNCPKQTDYRLDDETWIELTEIIIDEGLAKDVFLFPDYSGNHNIDYSNAKLTLNGINFLEENSNWSNVYKGLKGIMDFIK